MIPVSESALEIPSIAQPADAEPTKVDEVARAVLERADRSDRSDRTAERSAKSNKRKTEPTADTREFWETWAEEKTTREPVKTAEPAAAASDEDSTSERGERGEGRRGRDRGRGRDKDRGRGDKREKAAASEKSEDKPERTRGKKDTAVTPSPAAADGAQARLFISLGKKHGVSADDLRSLLSGPIGGDKARIGSVSLRDSHAHVRVPEDLVDAIIEGVHGTQHNEHDVTVERSRS
ncbi:MAG: DbpA RNA binding domain-containing protein [Kofleriaceae bacterium]